MAFIREYASAGDPFSLRRPKWLRKIKPGKLLVRGVKGAVGLVKKVAPAALSFIPGVGGIASKIFALTDRYGLPRDAAVEFARSYGLNIGDPDEFDTLEAGGGMSAYMGDDDELELDYMGDPSPRPAKKRKSAAAGPKAKAEKKRAKRQERAGRKGGGFGKVAGSIGRAAGAALPSVLEAISKGRGGIGGGPADPTASDEDFLRQMEAALSGKKPRGAAASGFRLGGKRRTMNPANVRALRRSIRRVEGFQTLVKRMHKAFPALRGPTTMRSSPRRARGHRAGCGCVVCRRAA